LAEYFRFIPPPGSGSGDGGPGFSDSVSSHANHPRNLSETFTFFDNFVVSQQVARQLMDSFQVVDNLNYSENAQKIFLEYLNFFTDSVSGSQTIHRNLSENIHLLDQNLSALRSYHRSATDSTSFSDSNSRKLNLPRHNTEYLPVEDSLTTRQVLVLCFKLILC
jgi:hypothetical protein